MEDAGWRLTQSLSKVKGPRSKVQIGTAATCFAKLPRFEEPFGFLKDGGWNRVGKVGRLEQWKIGCH